MSDIRNSTLPSASIRLNLFFMRIKFIIALPVIMQIITAYEMPMIFISDEPKSRSGENIINSTMGINIIIAGIRSVGAFESANML